ncbi:hypothetical protein [Evansella clarkii]|uniref:hypothetical protein n=1 Tax=Evansella clarkii TaxID=79879 RepID=UPI000B4353BF|nr:hypothetical protein [Evansella clarkii]
MNKTLQQSTSQNTDQFILPFSFIISSLIFLVIFSVGLASNPGVFSFESLRSPAALAMAHLFILGWATMLAMGAVYQLIQVVSQRPVHSSKLGFIHFGLYISGVTGLYISLPDFNLPALIIFGLLTVAGVVCFLVNVLLTLKDSQLVNPVISATKSALLYLGLTVATGLIMVLNFRFGFLGTFHNGIFLLHLWAGLIGWFLFLIAGYSFKMLPMFFLAHGHDEKWQKWILIALHGAIWVSAAAGAAGMASVFLPFSLALLSLGLVMLLVQISEIRKNKFKKNPGRGINFFITLLKGFTALSVVLFLLSIVNVGFLLQYSVLGPILMFYIFGFISLSIAAYLSKIIPFLWWTFRYGGQVGQKETPSLAIMVDENVAERKLWFQLAALILFICSLWTGLQFLIIGTAILFAFTIIFYILTIGKAFTY